LKILGDIMAGQGSSGNVIAAICNVFFPGLGQLVQGRILPALIFAIICVGGYALWWLVVPAIIAGLCHLYSIIDAATYKGNS
jgi:TM2 domain-containing membrane protein YozV